MRIPKFQLPSSCGFGPGEPGPQADVDVREEYANAFRTESYNEFWARVLSLTATVPSSSSSSTAATRLLSYRLFAELLLDPDQSTVINALDLAILDPVHKSLLLDYFSETAGASFLCGSLLKDVDRIRTQYRSLKSHLQLTPPEQLPSIPPRLREFLVSCESPFHSGSVSRIQSTQQSCSELLKRLESGRDKAKARIQSIKRMRNGSAVVAVALTVCVSLSVVIATHGLALLAAAPGLIPVSLRKVTSSTRRWTKVASQLDTAAKGMYTLTRDVDTISWMVARAGDEVEHAREVIHFWEERGKEGGRAGGDVAVELARSKKGCSLVEQLDELEEQLYLCFMTINRARKLVMEVVPITPKH
ncbi:hypothetical protein MLD38_002886 [Melastoma candidum]|uniref:Uncharacterized protein n=1 Tax=Melastoma candidum TaxID=119954 RepID=A0ACB9S254_9MYRT|nr:hypothetical protein MLD38_002886 [Melastoma candidum]